MPHRLHRIESTPSDHALLMTSLPRLQIVDASSSSKPDNYRISPASVSASSTASTSFKSVWEDWSGRGGSHVDFLSEEVLPLTEGRFLGHGVMGGVYETVISGHAFAWKRRFCRRKISDAERKEIEILKKLSHPHIIQLVGTYTHRQFLGLLLHPVAVCDLATFLDDYEGFSEGLESAQEERFRRLGIPFDSLATFVSVGGKYIYSKIGCLTSAVEYLHSQKIRHKDLKPSNILLSADGLWLTDFGSATDFSLLSTSATENGERGTPKYFAPEVAEYAPSGRSADIFSLGCILLELCTLIKCSTLKPLRDRRPALDKSFQANLHLVNDWFSGFRNVSPQLQHLLLEIKRMLWKDPQKRPSATEIRIHIGHINYFTPGHLQSLFDDCCKTSTMTVSEHKGEMAALEHHFNCEILALREELIRKHLEDMAEYLRKEEQRNKKLEDDTKKLEDDNKKLKDDIKDLKNYDMALKVRHQSEIADIKVAHINDIELTARGHQDKLDRLRRWIFDLQDDNEALSRQVAEDTRIREIETVVEDPNEHDKFNEANGWLKLEGGSEEYTQDGSSIPRALRRRDAAMSIPHRKGWEEELLANRNLNNGVRNN